MSEKHREAEKTIREAEVVLGFYDDPAQHGGRSFVLIKGRDLLITRQKEGRAGQVHLVQLACADLLEAQVYRLTLGDDKWTTWADGARPEPVAPDFFQQAKALFAEMEKVPPDKRSGPEWDAFAARMLNLKPAMERFFAAEAAAKSAGTKGR